ncbi:Aminotransferase [Lecanosticta acicola]|uniref:Aminotransferase n=1 Tax=Lecanosticta acicola TaxID=111012 RepID=A0AAI8YU51_9PEZI|nr:Aminotransferase [Lecanosticta acicola]
MLPSASSMAANGTSQVPLNLQLGWPTPRLTAREGLLQGAEEGLAEGSNMAPVLLYGPNKGHPPLCDSLASWLSAVYKPSAGPSEASRICITNGASASLANITMKFADPTYTRRVFMVEPTYFLACPIFEDCGFQGKLRGIPEGLHDGIDLHFLRAKLEEAESENGWSARPLAKTGPNYPHIYRYVLYCTTTYSNPSAKTMPIQIREELVEMARKFDMLLISDDVYDFLGWSVDERSKSSPFPAPPRLVDIDRSLPECTKYGNVVSNGSFAKVIGPGIRVGWVEGTASLVSCLGLVGSSSSGGAPSHFASTLVDRMLRNQSLQEHIQNILIPEYRRRSQVLTWAIENQLLPLGYQIEATGPAPGLAGGYFTYIRVPSFFTQHRVFAKTLAGIALQDYRLRIAFGHMFVVAGDESSKTRAEEDTGFAYCLRLSWSWLEAEQIAEAIDRLAKCTIDVRARVEAGEDVSKGIEIGIR